MLLFLLVNDLNFLLMLFNNRISFTLNALSASSSSSLLLVASQDLLELFIFILYFLQLLVINADLITVSAILSQEF